MIELPKDQELAIVPALIAFLQDRGYVVEYDPTRRVWFTPCEIAERLGLSVSAVSARLHHANCPVFERRPVEGRRIHSLRLNPALEKFLAQAKARKLRKESDL